MDAQGALLFVVTHAPRQVRTPDLVVFTVEMGEVHMVRALDGDWLAVSPYGDFAIEVPSDVGDLVDDLCQRAATKVQPQEEVMPSSA